ncbi:MAG TPA: hypothetical protein IAC31_02195 [Candidatus Faecousia intestinigallinarum]|nr:hypothetical protein [Candidatus Faecousia intestinigallinarum]
MNNSNTTCALQVVRNTNHATPLADVRKEIRWEMQILVRYAKQIICLGILTEFSIGCLVVATCGLLGIVFGILVLLLGVMIALYALYLSVMLVVISQRVRKQLSRLKEE